MISAWARMCKILGDQFVQYLPVVMKPLLRAASLHICIIFIDGECVTDMNLSCTKSKFWGRISHRRLYHVSQVEVFHLNPTVV